MNALRSERRHNSMKVSLAAWRHSVKSRTPSSRNCHSISTSPLLIQTALEEEALPYYEPHHYFPVRIGEVYKSRYKIVGKLGYGAYSTVWLCRDLNEHKYAALKVSTCLSKRPDMTRREYQIYEHLSTIKSAYPGQSGLRKLYDTFELDSSSGQHQCLVQPPMHMSLLEMIQLQGRPFDLALLKMTLKRLLDTFDFLHSEAEVIHGDLKTDNIMLSIEGQTMLKRYEQAEIAEPSPRKYCDDHRIIYKSRPFPKPLNHDYGLPMLCDLGEARIGRSQSSGPFVQPHIYRAPEVIFEMPWGPAIDIWNLAGLAWDLLEGKHLFGQIFDNQGHHDPFRHLASMVSLIGPPPGEFTRRSDTTAQCFDTDGNWIADEYVTATSPSLEDTQIRLEGAERQQFLSFMRSMLKWLPEERKSAKDLLQDPWLQD